MRGRPFVRVKRRSWSPLQYRHSFSVLRTDVQVADPVCTGVLQLFDPILEIAFQRNRMIQSELPTDFLALVVEGLFVFVAADLADGNGLHADGQHRADAPLARRQVGTAFFQGRNETAAAEIRQLRKRIAKGPAFAPFGRENQIEPLGQQVLVVTAPGGRIDDVNQEIEEGSGGRVEPFLLGDIAAQSFSPGPLLAGQLSSEPEKGEAAACNKKKEYNKDCIVL